MAAPSVMTDGDRLLELRRLVLDREQTLKAAGVKVEAPQDRQIKALLGIGQRAGRPAFTLADFANATKD